MKFCNDHLEFYDANEVTFNCKVCDAEFTTCEEFWLESNLDVPKKCVDHRKFKSAHSRFRLSGHSS